MKYIEFLTKTNNCPRAFVLESVIGVYEDEKCDTHVIVRLGDAKHTFAVSESYIDTLARIRLAQDEPLATQVSPESEVLRAGSKLQQIVKNIKRELSTFTSKDALREMMNTREVDDAVVEWDTAMGMATEA